MNNFAPYGTPEWEQLRKKYKPYKRHVVADNLALLRTITPNTDEHLTFPNTFVSTVFNRFNSAAMRGGLVLVLHKIGNDVKVWTKTDLNK